VLDETPGVASHYELQAPPAGETERFFNRIFARPLIPTEG
jgi:hypothetical protein